MPPSAEKAIVRRDQSNHGNRTLYWPNAVFGSECLSQTKRKHIRSYRLYCCSCSADHLIGNVVAKQPSTKYQVRYWKPED